MCLSDTNACRSKAYYRQLATKLIAICAAQDQQRRADWLTCVFTVHEQRQLSALCRATEWACRGYKRSSVSTGWRKSYVEVAAENTSRMDALEGCRLPTAGNTKRQVRQLLQNCRRSQCVRELQRARQQAGPGYFGFLSGVSLASGYRKLSKMAETLSKP